MSANTRKQEEIEITPEMEIAGAEALLAHLKIGGMDFARDVAREVFLAMSGRISKSHY